MTINFSSEDVRYVLPHKKQYKDWIRSVVESRGKRVGDISYRFCSDEHILKVNQDYLNHDTYTDIITFDYVEGDVVSGDIVISIDRVRDNAASYGVTFADELRRVIIHGVLHLLGQGDKTESQAAEMRRLEDEALLWWSRQD